MGVGAGEGELALHFILARAEQAQHKITPETGHG